MLRVNISLIKLYNFFCSYLPIFNVPLVYYNMQTGKFIHKIIEKQSIASTIWGVFLNILLGYMNVM